MFEVESLLKYFFFIFVHINQIKKILWENLKFSMTLKEDLDSV